MRKGSYSKCTVFGIGEIDHAVGEIAGARTGAGKGHIA